jgi:uncharacterized protein (DUF433 family)
MEGIMIKQIGNYYTIKGVKIVDILTILKTGSFMQVIAKYPNLTKEDVSEVIDLAIEEIDK